MPTAGPMNSRISRATSSHDRARPARRRASRSHGRSSAISSAAASSPGRPGGTRRPRLAVGDDLRHAAHVGRDNRQAARQGLDQHVGIALPQAGETEHVGLPHVFRHAVVTHFTSENHAVADAPPGGEFLDPAAQRAISHVLQPHVGARREEFADGLEQAQRVFLRAQPSAVEHRLQGAPGTRARGGTLGGLRQEVFVEAVGHHRHPLPRIRRGPGSPGQAPGSRRGSRRSLRNAHVTMRRLPKW